MKSVVCTWSNTTRKPSFTWNKLTFIFLWVSVWGRKAVGSHNDYIEEKNWSLLTLHESQEDQRGQPRHRHGEEQDATATVPVHGRPEQQPGAPPCAHRQQVRPVEAGGRAFDVTPERAVTVTNAVGDESEGGQIEKWWENYWESIETQGEHSTNCLKAVSGMTYEVKPSTHRFFQMFLL